MGIGARYPARFKVGALTVVLCALLSSGLALRQAVDGLPTTHDEVTGSEVRLQRLKAALPPRGVVGYLSEPRWLEVPGDPEYGKRRCS